MTTFKKYLTFRLKKSFLRTVVFSLIALVATYIVVYANAVPFVIIGNPEYNGNTGIFVLVWIIVILSVAIPVLETTEFKNKRNLDTFCSLPLSRFDLALAHYISGFVQMFAIYTVSFITLVLVVLPYAEHFRLGYLPAYYVFSLILGLGLYSFYTFIFGEANTVLDGAIFCAMWTFGGGFLLLYIVDFITAAAFDLPTVVYNDLNVSPWLFGVSFAPLNNITELFLHNIEPKANVSSSYFTISRHFESLFVWALIYAACACGYFCTFARKGTEKAGEISDTWFGYKMLIPIYGFLCAGMDSYMLNALWLAAMFTGYMIYRRGIRLAKSDIIVLIIHAVIFFPLAELSRFQIIFLASIPFFIVSLCLLISESKKNREHPELRDKKRMLKLGALAALSAALLLVCIITEMRHLIEYLF